MITTEAAADMLAKFLALQYLMEVMYAKTMSDLPPAASDAVKGRIIADFPLKDLSGESREAQAIATRAMVELSAFFEKVMIREQLMRRPKKAPPGP